MGVRREKQAVSTEHFLPQSITAPLVLKQASTTSDNAMSLLEKACFAGRRLGLTKKYRSHLKSASGKDIQTAKTIWK
jgi:hypothetical protein